MTDRELMPLSEFPPDKAAAIIAAAYASTPPPRWRNLGNAMIESRAWHEWHRVRGIEEPDDT
jgi:hypothetical protein